MPKNGHDSVKFYIIHFSKTGKKSSWIWFFNLAIQLPCSGIYSRHLHLYRWPTWMCASRSHSCGGNHLECLGRNRNMTWWVVSGLKVIKSNTMFASFVWQEKNHHQERQKEQYYQWKKKMNALAKQKQQILVRVIKLLLRGKV